MAFCLEVCFQHPCESMYYVLGFQHLIFIDTLFSISSYDPPKDAKIDLPRAADLQVARQLTEAKEAEPERKEAEPPKAAVPQGGVSQRFQVPSGGVELFGKKGHGFKS